MIRSTLTRALATAALSLSVSACTAPDLTGTCPIPPGATPAEAATILSSCFGKMDAVPINTRAKQDVDILFVIDNSPSMSPKQKQLAIAIKSFIEKIDKSGSNYHVGVTSTDIGAQQAPNTAFQPGNLNIPGCDTYKGNDGELQHQACSNRDQSKWSGDAKTACVDTAMPVNSLCPVKLEPTNGDVFLFKQDGQTNAPNNDIIGTFKCIALLGDNGCGLESPLEAAKRALDGHSTTNSGFLRQNSVLAVIFVTDEDDCSVQMTARAQNNPNSIDCTTSGASSANCWKNDFRCLANNLKCNEPLTSTGAKTGCVENGNGYLESVDKYVRFFSNLRSSNKIVLAGIWTPTLLDNPNSDVTKPGKLVVDYDSQVCVPGPGIKCSTEALNRGISAWNNTKMIAEPNNAACFYKDPMDPVQKSFFGQAQLRLSSFIRKFDVLSRVEQSVCDPMNYGTVLDVVADRITNRISANCLSGKPKTDANGNPICIVGLVDQNTPAAIPDVRLKQCSAKCCKAWAVAGDQSNPDPLVKAAQPIPNDQTIVAACSADPDCYCAVPNPTSNVACKDSTNQDTALAGLWINAAPHQTPSLKVANFMCAVSVK